MGGTIDLSSKKISDQLVSNTSSKKPTLIHAVTGAGKTEMIYASIASVVNQGGWVCIASPRVDVRLARDFSCEVCLMHAQSLAYKRCPIIIATTHQLMKFYKAFDLLIVDEVDAFPLLTIFTSIMLSLKHVRKIRFKYCLQQQVLKI